MSTSTRGSNSLDNANHSHVIGKDSARSARRHFPHQTISTTEHFTHNSQWPLVSVNTFRGDQYQVLFQFFAGLVPLMSFLQ